MASRWPPGECKQNARKFSCHLHAQKLLLALNDNRHNAHLCDAIVVIGEEKKHVQKNVLSAASHYFRALFNYGEATETENGKTVINLGSASITMATFTLILDFLYTAEINLCPDTIQDVLQAADLFLLNDLKVLCCDYLDTCITPTNCIGIREFSSQYTCSWLLHKVTRYLDEHFREVSFCDEFLSLSADAVTELLNRDTLVINSEDDILDAIIRWFRFDVQGHQAEITDAVTRCVRAAQISESFLEEFEDPSPDLNRFCLPKLIRDLRQTATELRPRGFSCVLLACGGEGNVSDHSDDSEVKATVNCVKIYNQGTSTIGQWISLPNMNSPRTGHGMVEVGGSIYVFGGRDRHCQILNTGEKYDPNTNTWTVCAPMAHARVGFGLVAVDDNIYAIGGSNDMTDPLTFVETYNVFSNKWQSLPDMTMKRVWSAYAAVGKKIYVIAGGTVGKFYEAVECFDTRTETWVSVCPMRERRCDARAVTVDEDIYVFGGFRRFECPSAMHSGHSLKFCGTEIYSTCNDHWLPMCNKGGVPGMCTMTDASHIEGAVYNGEDVLVVGDLDIGNAFHCVRAYNKITNSWRCVVQNKPKNQRFYQVCLLHMPNAVLRKLLWDQEKMVYSDLK
ncbi:gigaxonin-like [Haliotis cracherodii]|uniref:gigaxonin-like n=1 Tax=Haliotis cracherodii TaxID=6455 RepID=UPI0039E9F14C